jgi:hypothetical protein
MRCLEKDPDRRFQSADEFTAALDLAIADVQSQQGAPQPVVPAIPDTLIRPANPRPVAPATAEDAAVPAAQPPAGTGSSYRRIAAALVAIVAVAAGVALALRGSDPVEDSPLSQVSQPAGVPSPTVTVLDEPIPVPPSVPVAGRTSPVNVGPPPSDTRSITTGQPEHSRGRAPSEGFPEVAPPIPQTVALPAPQPAPSPTAQTAPPQEPPAAPASAAPPPVVPPAPAPQSRPSVSVTCKGLPDVCGVVRGEIVQALQRDGFPVLGNQAPADATVTVNVALVSETPSTQFGTPTITRTYSVLLTGTSRGGAIVMPEPRVFGFDNVFGTPRLQENARLIAAGAVDSLRGFTTNQIR